MRVLLKFIIISLISWQSFGQLPHKTETIRINGIAMYYEVYGEGEPLLLLHGWTQSSRFWSDFIPAYAKNFTVYAIDLRGHGKSSKLTNGFSIKKAALDILAFMDYFKLRKVKAIGLSYGALALLELTSLHAEAMEAMILIGAAHSYSGRENNRSTFSYENLPESFIQDLKNTHYQGEVQIRALFDKNLNYQINLSDAQMKTIGTRTLIVHGDRDAIMGLDRAIDLHKKMPNSELWIVPNTGHLAITGVNQKDFLVKSVQFLLKP